MTDLASPAAPALAADTSLLDDAGKLWKLTLEHSPVGMALVSIDGVVVMANHALCTMLGYDEAQLRSFDFRRVTHPDDLDADLERYHLTLAGDIDSYRLTKRYLHADGSVVWGDLSVSLLRDHHGEPVHFITQVVDVTLQHTNALRLTDALEHVDRERRLAQAILDTVDVGLVLLNRDGQYERMSRTHADFLRLAFPDGHRGHAGQVGEVFGADGVTRLDRDEMPTTMALNGQQFDGVRIWVGEDPPRRRAYSVSGRTVLDDDGQFAGAALAYNDITVLMRALDARDEFVDTVSHELRTPLTAVLGRLELLMIDDEVELDGEVGRGFEAVYRNALRLQRVVSDLIESAEQRHGEQSLVRTSTDVGLVVGEAVEAARASAIEKDVAILVRGPADLLLDADHERLRQVADNLITNAIKYTAPGGRIDVSVDSVDGQLVIAVEDTGIGIEADDLTNVFDPFFRATNAVASQAPGLGLGLGVVRSIVRAHGGTVHITSRPGVGTEIQVRLPITATS